MPTPPHTVLLDGIFGRPHRFKRLRKAIEGFGGSTSVFKYASGGTVKFEKLGEQFAKHLREMNQPVNVVAFSFGGIVVRAARQLDPSLPIERAVFMNCPHGGNLMAWVMPLPGTWQLRPGSRFLRSLDESAWEIPTLTIWSPFDPVVIPGGNSKWDKAQKQIASYVPLHNWPIHSRRMHRVVAEFLGAS